MEDVILNGSQVRPPRSGPSAPSEGSEVLVRGTHFLFFFLLLFEMTPVTAAVPAIVT